MLKKALIPFLIASITFALVVRFLWLDRFPVGMDADQTEVALSAKTINLFGVDSSGQEWYKSVFGNNTKAGIAGLPSILISPINSIFNLSLTNIRIVFVFINIITIVFISLFVSELFKNKLAFLFTMFIGLINPWMFSYSRLPTEAPFSLLLLTIGLYLFVKLKERSIFYSLPFLVSSFYSYFGAKPILILLVPLIVIGKYFLGGKKNIKMCAIYLFAFFLLIGSYFYFSSIDSTNTFASRNQKEILLLNPNIFNETVNEYRRTSIDFPFKNILFNKYTVTSFEFVKKYTSWISSDFLFWKGDSRGIYTFQDHGLFYLIDSVFMLFGLLFIKNNRQAILLLTILFILSPIPSALSLNGDSLFYRGFLLIFSLIILISSGVYFVYKISKEKFKGILIFILLLIYLSLFLNFLLFYFFRYPVKQHSNNFIEGRIIASYIKRNQNNKMIFVATTSPYSVFNEYVFYNNITNEELKRNLSKEKNEYLLKNVMFTDKCPKPTADQILFIDSKLNCELKGNNNYLVLHNQSDSGVTFKIYNNVLCDLDNLTSYRRDHKITDYNIEDLDDKIFCNRWIQNGKTN